MNEEKWEQLELPFTTAGTKSTTTAKPPVREGVDQVPECWKTWAEIEEGRYVCKGCGGSYSSATMYENHLALPDRRKKR